MAIDSYMFFVDYQGKYLPSESQVDLTGTTSNAEIFGEFKSAQDQKGLFEISDYSFDIEQVLNIGSQSSGAGAGKVTFNPFSITRNVDKASPPLFQMACSGTPFKTVSLGMRKGGGGTVAGAFFLQFSFKLVAVKTISWAHDDESPKETTTFEYGGFVIRYGQQAQDGSVPTLFYGGWNRVQNKSMAPGQDITYVS